MRLLLLLSLIASVASTALNVLARQNIRSPSTVLPDLAATPTRRRRGVTAPFTISHLYAQSLHDSAETMWNSSLSFVFSDPNSNTSTSCSKSWTDYSGNSSTAPLTYVSCDDTGNEEDFEWQFVSYTNIQKFSIEFSHGWNDPVDFPAPFSFVNTFSSSNVFNLTCGLTASGAKGCHLPGDTPYSAAITGISD